MIVDYPGRLIAIALFLLLFGFVMPFLITLKIVESTLFLNFLSFGASVLGLFLGIAGIAGLRLKSKNKDDGDDHHR